MAAFLNLWVSTTGEHIFPIILGTDSPLGSKIIVMKQL